MRGKTIIVSTVGLVVGIALFGGAGYLLRRPPEALCSLSGRPINAQTRARVTIGGRRYETCCLRCGITEARQTGKPLRVLEVADFETGKLLSADKAWYVESSAVNPCMNMTPGAQRSDRQSVCLLGFDRCSPSVLAFSSEELARAFIAQRGGVLKRLEELQQETKPVAGAKMP